MLKRPGVDTPDVWPDVWPKNEAGPLLRPRLYAPQAPSLTAGRDPAHPRGPGRLCHTWVRITDS